MATEMDIVMNKEIIIGACVAGLAVGIAAIAAIIKRVLRILKESVECELPVVPRQTFEFSSPGEKCLHLQGPRRRRAQITKQRCHLTYQKIVNSPPRLYLLSYRFYLPNIFFPVITQNISAVVVACYLEIFVILSVPAVLDLSAFYAPVLPCEGNRSFCPFVAVVGFDCDFEIGLNHF